MRGGVTTIRYIILNIKFGWLPEGCYAVARMLCLVEREFLCSC